MTPAQMVEKAGELAKVVEGLMNPPVEEGKLPLVPDQHVVVLGELVEMARSLASTVGSVDGNHFRLAMRLQAIEEERGTTPEAGHRRNLQKAFELLATVEAQLPRSASARRSIKRARRELEKAIGKLAAEGETEAGKVLGADREKRRAEKGGKDEKRKSKGSKKDDDFDVPEEVVKDDDDFDDAGLGPVDDPDDEDDDDDEDELGPVKDGDDEDDEDDEDEDDEDDDDDLIGDAGSLKVPGPR